MEIYNYKHAGENFKFQLLDNAFVPTGTSTMMVECVKKHLKEPCEVLDLGCGVGIVGILLNHYGLVKGDLYASDLGESAVEACLKNAALHKCNAVVKQGSIFEPWSNMKFDCIVNDISGVAGEVANISPWFEGVDCDAGDDGSELVNKVIVESEKHLNTGGVLFFPIISLSNTQNIIETAKNNFKKVECLARKNWPLPKEMLNHKEMLLSLKKQGFIDIEEKFGLIQWYTEIYIAYN